MQATRDVEYGGTSIGFAWIGLGEKNEVSGEGTAELTDEGFIELAFEHHNGDEVVLKAKREPFLAACWAILGERG